MKKIYITGIALVASSICAFAQPVLDESDFSPNYSADVYITNTSVAIIEDTYRVTLGMPGPNQIWGFYELPFADPPIGTYTVVPLSSALNVSFFPSANYCVKSNYSDLFGGDSDVYQMYNISSLGIKLLGKTSDLGVLVCPEENIFFPFPYSYGTEFSGTHNCGEPVPYEFATIYDASGTLITPFGIYEDVIREKTVSNSDYILTYTWLKAHPFSVIMEMNIALNGDAVIYVYNETTSLNVNEVNKENKITIYPNPSSSFVNLRLSNQNIIDKVVITDLTGKIVLQQNPNAGQIDVQGLSRGMYVLQVFSENEKYQTKFIKE